MTQTYSAGALLKSRTLRLSCITSLWLLALIPGVHYLLAFEGTSGRTGIAPSDWHTLALSSGDAHSPTLLVALHPKCSCSNATLTELEEAALTFGRPANTIFLIDPPQGTSFDWRQITSYREAQKALLATVVIDTDGKLAADFGAFTSGDVLLYSAEDSHGRRSLRFSGGVTGARGMVGPNSGVEALVAAFHNSSSKPPSSAPVFGCGLLNKAISADERKKD